MTTWGLTVSAQKSAIMCFTLKSSPAPPTITLCGEAVNYIPHTPSWGCGWMAPECPGPDTLSTSALPATNK
ncbi:hypothetical protein E2C01_047236 [Portunus trituberculatus]|uniref:Uncharacterized protein n=1 Tax=Portunus trituberculatus TaxID=210409 RepID=A0A5B7G712_PORTR|nr:hypothetical protein [Portunus trituberculatus]